MTPERAIEILRKHGTGRDGKTLCCPADTLESMFRSVQFVAAVEGALNMLEALKSHLTSEGASVAMARLDALQERAAEYAKSNGIQVSR